MALKKIMYPGQVNSRETITTSALNATDTSLTVLDGGLLPDAPNLLVLGAGSTAETVLMTAKDGNVLTLQRGFQGVPKTWALGTVIARNFTEYDYAAMLENITDVEGRLVATDGKVADNTSAIGQNTHDISQLSNPSLIINPDFQVWQRGIMLERISGKYTADRWLYDTPGKASGFNGKIEKIANGLKLTQLDGFSMNHRFRYLMEILESLKGQKLTLTLKYKTNKVFGVSFLGNSFSTVADSNVNTLKLTGTYSGNLELFSMVIYNNTDTSMFLELYSVKVELGEIATLLSPRSYGEELALCQRYYIAKTAGRMTQYGANDMYFLIPIPARMRTSPTINSSYIGTLLSGVAQAGFNVNAFDTSYNTSIAFIATKTAHGLTDGLLIINGLDAEIY